ncbi:uncharacterized protein K02A2.6-like [Ornithodoros turicata]|uniref:uncharacterized protein K02A2.6-like n=1 Tax=Ornithodoros turicata TaxID=34597 RepID=UPI00313978AF
MPESEEGNALGKPHVAHRGIAACKTKAREAIYWSSMNQDIETLIGRCQTCQRYQRNNQREPLEDRIIPTRPWQRIGLDLFYLKGATYLLIVDYFSKFVELQSMNSTAVPAVINDVKAVCARFGLPDGIACDNGPPFDSQEFKGFLPTWDIVHNPTAPYNPRSNGVAERSVQTLKHSLLKASEDGTDLFLVLKYVLQKYAFGRLKVPCGATNGKKDQNVSSHSSAAAEAPVSLHQCLPAA